MTGPERKTPPRFEIPTPPLPQWLADAVGVFPAPTGPLLRGFVEQAWALGYQAGVLEARRRRRGTKRVEPDDG